MGGSPSAYLLAKATGTNGGFVGCIQSLTINNRVTDIRPWPLGKALSGADIGEEANRMLNFSAFFLNLIFLLLIYFMEQYFLNILCLAIGVGCSLKQYNVRT